MNILEIYEDILHGVSNDDPSVQTYRGKRFEKVIQTYLQEDPIYKNVLSDVWLWNDWPDKDGVDKGIDIVAKEKISGNLWAIQCKFYESNNVVPKEEINKFLAESGRPHFTQRYIFTTATHWSKNAEKTIEGQAIPCQLITIDSIFNSPVDYEAAIDTGKVIQPKKKLYSHQKTAFKKVIAGFENYDRGKLIMACGTGKTFVSLKIMEKIVSKVGSTKNVLFLVPSLSLLSQTLREWSIESTIPQRNLIVCSDTKVGKNEEGKRIYELDYPATTDGQKLAKKLAEPCGKDCVTVVFSTYHSIKVVVEAQERGALDFDLIICDEAHCTTGVENIENDKELSFFNKVHDNDYIKSKRRLYMTATPRIYTDNAKAKAKENDIGVFSMDEVKVYGPEFYRLDFSEAVSKGLLSDYRVLVLAVGDDKSSEYMQNSFNQNSKLKLNDVSKIIGVLNGLNKRIINSGDAEEVDNKPMRRAIAFTNTIESSKHITKEFKDVAEKYRNSDPDFMESFDCQFEHVDGTQNSRERDSKLNWLGRDFTDNEKGVCRVLSNVRCLSEGVDVPALDAVIFLNPRRSVIDIVQSVGRVMRKADEKQYGYIILPIAVPNNMSAEEALQDDKKYAGVWSVLRALRSHDNRFNARINQLELNKNRPDIIQIIGVGIEEENKEISNNESSEELLILQSSLFMEELCDAFYAKLVATCGDRRYWETWAADIATIADANITRINGFLRNADDKIQKKFKRFHKGLKNNINPFITESDAIEMLSQHLITKPIFNALFEHDFTAQNPVSKSMQGMVKLLENQNIDEESNKLERFYSSVRDRVEGIDNDEGKQKIISELYDKFFKTAFPKMSERLGIVYTPVEVIDFILQSVQDTMQTEFDKGLSDEDVHILDPFTGMGSFIVADDTGGIY